LYLQGIYHAPKIQFEMERISFFKFNSDIIEIRVINCIFVKTKL
jgi:hypothetical protein